MHGTQLPKERVGMLKTLVTSGADALAVSLGLGYRTIGVQSSFRAESSWVVMHTCTCEVAHPILIQQISMTCSAQHCPSPQRVHSLPVG